MSIIQNKKAFHDFFIEDKYEAGLMLQGWEVKAIRAGRAQLKEAYVVVKDNELWLIGSHISPLTSASTHILPDPTRTRKLLLHKKELAKIFAAIQQKGNTCVCTKIYWKDHLVKCQIALAKGKHTYDKRASLKEREWNIDKQRSVRVGNR